MIQIKVADLKEKPYKSAFSFFTSQLPHFFTTSASEELMGLTGKLIGWIRLGPLSCLLVRLFGSPEAKRRLKNLDALPEAIGMRPEVELINYHVMALAGIRNLANASAFMALTWSTVVLLGGFITSLRIRSSGFSP